MYQEAGYGANWQPEANNARRIDPNTKTYVTLGGLFAIGLVLIVIVVLSLIPLYMSHTSSSKNTNTNTNTTNNIQVSQIFVNSFSLQIRSPFDGFNSQTILLETNNRQALQAALTSMIQKDSLVNGSVVHINNTSMKSNRQIRQTSNFIKIIFDLNIISSNPCSIASCLNDFQSRVIQLLSGSNMTTSRVYCERTNSTEVYWLYFQLPQTIQPNSSLIYADLNQISSLLNQLLTIDKNQNQNQQTIESSTSNLFA
ncbi:unnamed protein product [Rotaria socialis]|uniref:Uncharacterized protein n=1 Tax=Rotaria socialis TaxID=392032 RepID=A0A819ZBA1_9BILA|nr:unnamed protein product [Rotaria socialis]CAF3355398.1 unnamed protein product [Rotaria socialis]CAF3450204.1 unnamed protein product [Rotaria socialis]CAF3524069.1 unnamed protein product [Rotaria socialis]CAF4168246.1 unnamed protein product [Rotaria socialis]